MTKTARIVSRTLRVLLVLACLAVGAMAEDDGGSALKSTLLGSTPGQIIGGVNAGGLPWTVSKGQTSLNADGSLKVDIKGLVLLSVGTTGPVTEVSASLVCGGGGGAVVATTKAVPLTVTGNAHIHDKIAVPPACIASIILVRVAAVNGTPLAQPGPFIAATGFSAAQAEGDSKKDDSADRF
jgi:hypothetical protein